MINIRMINIGGISNYQMVGRDTIKGNSLKKFPPEKGKIPWATDTVVEKFPNTFEILWVDARGKKKQGIIRVKKIEKEV